MAIVTGERAKIKILEELGPSRFVSFHFIHTTSFRICDEIVQRKQLWLKLPNRVSAF
jgi:hypothetical protein